MTIFREPTPPDCACCRKSIKQAWGSFRLPSGIIYLCNNCSEELCEERLTWAKWRLMEEGWKPPFKFKEFISNLRTKFSKENIAYILVEAINKTLTFLIKYKILEIKNEYKIPNRPMLRD